MWASIRRKHCQISRPYVKMSVSTNGDGLQEQAQFSGPSRSYLIQLLGISWSLSLDYLISVRPIILSKFTEVCRFSDSAVDR